MEWVSNTSFSTDFKREPAEESKIFSVIYNLDTNDDFGEKNYSLKLNLPSFREFGNVYNEDYMTLFTHYPIVMIGLLIIIG
jgi:hypothetical protein